MLNQFILNIEDNFTDDIEVAIRIIIYHFTKFVNNHENLLNHKSSSDVDFLPFQDLFLYLSLLKLAKDHWIRAVIQSSIYTFLKMYGLNRILMLLSIMDFISVGFG